MKYHWSTQIEDANKNVGKICSDVTMGWVKWMVVATRVTTDKLNKP